MVVGRAQYWDCTPRFPRMSRPTDWWLATVPVPLFRSTQSVCPGRAPTAQFVFSLVECSNEVIMILTMPVILCHKGHPKSPTTKEPARSKQAGSLWHKIAGVELEERNLVESLFVLFFLSSNFSIYQSSREQPRTSLSMWNNHWTGKTSHTTFQRLI